MKAASVSRPSGEPTPRARSGHGFFTPPGRRTRVLPILSLGAALQLLPGSATLGHSAERPGSGPEFAVERTDGDQLTVHMPPVVITARGWEEDLHQVPASVTALPGTLVEEAGVRTVQEASRYAPNVHVTEFSARRLSFPYIRGIGAGQGEPAVATYLDGVPLIAAGSANLPLVQVERVEFLRGPQSTLYGRNALGGVLQVVTREPPPLPEFGFTAGGGNHGLRELGVSAGGPLGDPVAAGAHGLYSTRDGYTTNDFTGDQVDDRRSLFGRLQGIWESPGGSRWRLLAHGEDARDGGFVLSDLEGLRARPFRIDQDFEGKADRTLYSVALTGEIRAPTWQLTSATAFQGWGVEETSDVDFTNLDIARRATDQDQAAFSQEFRVGSPGDGPGGGARRWLVGLFLFGTDTESDVATDLRPGGAALGLPVGQLEDRGEFSDAGVGVFGQVNLPLGERLEFGAGLRFDWERRDAELRHLPSGATLPDPAREEEHTSIFRQWSPRLSATLLLSPEVRAYASAGRGYRAGGFNLSPPPGRTAYGPEVSWTYEVGVKGAGLDNRVRGSLTGFYLDWSDMQVNLFDPATRLGFVDNAAEASSRGVEAELWTSPSRSLDLFASFGYVDARYEEFTDSFGGDVADNHLAFAPRTTWGLGGQLRGNLGQLRCSARLEQFAVGRFYYDPGNREGESYRLWNVRVSMGWDAWILEGWVRNALDEEYIPVALPSDPSDPARFVGQNGDPRTFGLNLKAQF